MVLPELCAYLAAYSPSFGVVGTSIFYGLMPEDPDVCIALYEYTGLPAFVEIGGLTPKNEFPRIQVAARGLREDQNSPRLVIQKVIAAFIKVAETSLSGITYHAAVNLNPPMGRQDASFRWVFTTNFQVDKDWSAS